MTARLIRIACSAAAAVCAIATAGACSSGEPPGDTPQPSQLPAAGAAVEPRADLTRRVAAAKDRRFTAAYSFTGAGAQRTVTVTKAADGTWRVDVPGGALGGQADVSLVGRPEGVYQCAAVACVRVARTADTLPSEFDPKVHHPFSDWPGVLTDRDAPVAVAVAKQLPGAAGACFSVEPTTVAITPPIEAGIFCYDDSGLPTGVKARFGTLVLAGPPAPPPPTAVLTGPVTAGPALSTEAPAPPPVPSVSPAPSTAPARSPTPRR